MSEYREAARKLTLAGYDIADPGHAISDVSQRLEAVGTARKTERKLAAEYRTLLQVRRYVKLANEPRFIKGPEWEKMSQENAENAKAMTAAEHSKELTKENPHTDRIEEVNAPQNRKTFRSGIDI